MIRAAVQALALVGITLVTPAAAQRPYTMQGVPPGHLPPPGLCRVWFDNVPPGRQPSATNCRTAEAIAARNRHARVIYGAIDGPRSAYDDRYRDYQRRGPAFEFGYRDGYDEGLDDGRDRDRHDPSRHGRYRSGDHGYDRRLGSRNDFRLVYREGFLAGYEAGYQDGRSSARWRDRW